MASFFIFIIAFIALLIVFIRRFKLTKQDLFLQEQLQNEEQKKDLINEVKKEAILNKKNESSKTKVKNEEIAAPSPSKNAATVAQIARLLNEAEDYLAKGKIGTAIKTYQVILALDGRHLEASRRLGCLYLKQEEFAASENIFRQLLDFEEDPVTLSNLGLALFNQKKYIEAASAYEKAISLDNSRLARYISLAHVYHAMGEVDKALKNFEKVAELDPRNPEYLFIIADYYQQKGDSLKVRQLLDRILDLDPYNEEAKEKLSQIGIPS